MFGRGSEACLVPLLIPSTEGVAWRTCALRVARWKRRPPPRRNQQPASPTVCRASSVYNLMRSSADRIGYDMFCEVCHVSLLFVCLDVHLFLCVHACYLSICLFVRAVNRNRFTD
ncbi:unnamed protein product [Scytosiphon promiscuus]